MLGVAPAPACIQCVERALGLVHAACSALSRSGAADIACIKGTGPDLAHRSARGAGRLWQPMLKLSEQK